MSELALPDGWIKTEISNIAEVIAGGTPSSKNPDYFCEPGTGISWLTPADLTGYEKMYISHGRRDITEAGYNSSSAKLMPKGSVVFSSRAPIGYVAITEKDLSTNQGFKSFVIPDELSSEYLYFYLKSIKGLAESLGTGTTFKELSGRACKKLPLVMAPLAEQKVIASTLESYLTTVSQIQARLDAIPKLIERFRQSVLKSYLLEGDVVYKSYILGDIVDIISGVAFKKAQYTEGGSKLLQISNVGHGHIRWKSKLFIPDELAEEFSEYKLQKKDIILALNRPITHNKLKVAAIHEKDIPSVLYQRVARLRVSDSSKVIDSSYLFILMQSGFFRKLVTEKLKGSDQPYLNFSDLKQFSLDLPSLDYQREVVDRIDNFLLYADQIEKSVAIAKARVDNLTQSILHQAFTGQLTKEWREQNPALITGDNSAEALLVKIEAEKKESKAKKKK